MLKRFVAMLLVAVLCLGVVAVEATGEECLHNEGYNVSVRFAYWPVNSWSHTKTRNIEKTCITCGKKFVIKGQSITEKHIHTTWTETHISIKDQHRFTKYCKDCGLIIEEHLVPCNSNPHVSNIYQ